MAVSLIFYTTAGCHLCEQAAAMLTDLQARESFRVEPVDIAGDEVLVEKYGIRIPVLKNAETDKELGWPFTSEQVIGLL